MTTFLQISGIVFWLCVIAVFVDLMYTRHYKWIEGLKVWCGKKHSKKYPKKRSREFRDVLPEPLKQWDDGGQT